MSGHRVSKIDKKKKIITISESDGADAACEICNGGGWVCENHRQNDWKWGQQTCCGGAGAPCKCNPLNDEMRAGEFFE